MSSLRIHRAYWAILVGAWKTVLRAILTAGPHPRNFRNKCVAASKAERSGDLKSALTLDEEMQNLEFAQLVLVFSSVFPHYAPFPPFGIAVHIP